MFLCHINCGRLAAEQCVFVLHKADEQSNTCGTCKTGGLAVIVQYSVKSL